MRHTISFVIAALGLNGSVAWANQEAALVQGWYQQYLHRDAEPCGLNNWVSIMRCKGPEAVQTGILASDEYYHTHGCSPEGFVAGLYVDVLGRMPCASEIQGWVCNLGRCGCRMRLAQDFLCAASRELAQRAMTVPPIAYQPAPAVAPPIFNSGYGYSPYQMPSAFRSFRQFPGGAPFGFR